MMKTDKSKHNICIAAIKRSTFKPYNYKFTKFYESNSDFHYSELKLNFSENELIICSTVIDTDNYSVLTTQQLITNEKGVEKTGSLVNASVKPFGDFKGLNGDLFTFGLLQLENEVNLKYFIETGKGSMIMIHGIRTLVRMQQMTNK